MKLDRKKLPFPSCLFIFCQIHFLSFIFCGGEYKKTPLFFCDSPPMIRVFWCSGTRLGARACDSLFFSFLSFFPERSGLFLVLARPSSLEGHSRPVPSTSHGSVTFTQGTGSAPAPRAFLCSVSVCSISFGSPRTVSFRSQFQAFRRAGRAMGSLMGTGAGPGPCLGCSPPVPPWEMLLWDARSSLLGLPSKHRHGPWLAGWAHC